MFKNTDSPKKSDLTRERLYDTALDLIRKQGFETTTMREIAKKAGVAPGAIYYYFESKESLIHEYYKQTHVDHMAALGDFLKRERSFEKRLHYVVTTKIQTALPHKKLAGALFRSAADPASPMSPFSPESRALRDEVVGIMREVMEGSDEKFNSEIKANLPDYLWLYLMGVILFWIYDSSPESRQTFAIIDRTVPLLASLNQLLNSPLSKPFRKPILELLKTFAPSRP